MTALIGSQFSCRYYTLVTLYREDLISEASMLASILAYLRSAENSEWM